jgi:hypothetical protein
MAALTAARSAATSSARGLAGVSPAARCRWKILKKFQHFKKIPTFLRKCCNISQNDEKIVDKTNNF